MGAGQFPKNILHRKKLLEKFKYGKPWASECFKLSRSCVQVCDLKKILA